MEVSSFDLSPWLGFDARDQDSLATEARVMAGRRSCVCLTVFWISQAAREGFQCPVPTVPSEALWSLSNIRKAMGPRP